MSIPTLNEIEQAIYEHYRNRTAEIIRVLGRESYLESPVVIQEVGEIANLWGLFDRAVAQPSHE